MNMVTRVSEDLDLLSDLVMPDNTIAEEEKSVDQSELT